MRIQFSGLCTSSATKKAVVQMGAVLLAAAVLFNVPREVRAGKTSTTSDNVTTIVHDKDTSGSLLLLRSDDYNDSGLNEATYSAALDTNLTSDIYAGAWVRGQSGATLVARALTAR